MRGRYVEGTHLQDVYGGYLSSLFEQMVTNLICNRDIMTSPGQILETTESTYQYGCSVKKKQTLYGHSLKVRPKLCAGKQQK